MNLCPTCKNPSGFLKNGIEKIFCSYSCARASRKIGRFIPCKYCAKEIYVRPCEENTKSFCSRSCNAKFNRVNDRRKTGIFISCFVCGNKKYFTPSEREKRKEGNFFCSRVCVGKENGFQKYSECKPKPKYKKCRVNGKMYLLHRKIMEEHLGRQLNATEHIHHINGNFLDNRIENLTILSPSEHALITNEENPKKRI